MFLHLAFFGVHLLLFLMASTSSVPGTQRCHRIFQLLSILLMVKGVRLLLLLLLFMMMMSIIFVRASTGHGHCIA